MVINYYNRASKYNTLLQNTKRKIVTTIKYATVIGLLWFVGLIFTV